MTKKLVVPAPHRLTLRTRFVGSIADKIARNANCSVLLVRG